MPSSASNSSPQDRPKGFKRVINAVGFKKVHNFILWFILAGAMTGFVLARFQYLRFSTFCPENPGPNGAAPGECYWFTMPRYKVGILLHLSTILPASLLAVFQFTPFIRHNFRLYHRIAGYLAVILGVTSTVGVFMISDRSFGGTVTIQAFFGALSIAFIGALGLAVYNIRMKQIEQHRAWMLRAWIWAGSIITLRLMMIIGAQIISVYPLTQRLYLAYSCDVLQYILRSDDDLIARYPTCAPLVNGTNTLGTALQTAVQANFRSGRVEELSAAMQACFPMAAWLAWVVHIVGVELYLNLTPGESERLRRISYEKQAKAGSKHPGSAGLTSDRLGDAEMWDMTAYAESHARVGPVLSNSKDTGGGVSV